jgi:hypothetical protein
MTFRFTIRDLLWLTVVAALAVGWSLDTRPKLIPPPLVTIEPAYDRAKVSKAVQSCISRALGSDDPFSELKIYLRHLAADGWTEVEIDAVRRDCDRALLIIYDISIP